MPLHDDEIPIDLALVRALVDRAFPQYAGEELRPLGASGSSNALFRLGDELLVRLPRQPGGTASIEKEARWLPVFAPRLPVPVPQVVAVGEPDLGYPERWSVTTWLEGRPPTVVTGAADGDRRALAADLAEVVSRLRGLAVPAGAAEDPSLRWYRGQPLHEHEAAFRETVDACRRIPDLDLDLDALVRVWDAAVAAPAAAQEPRWFHGDLCAENLLVRDGRLAGVLDFGGLAVGDPTIDLVLAWEVLDAAGRDTFRQALGVDDGAWLRGRGWAVFLTTMTFPYYRHTMPARCADRLAMARAVLAEAD